VVRRFALPLLIAFAMAAGGGNADVVVADAKPSSATKEVSKKRAKKRKRTKKRRRKKKANMPRNWTWPPNKEMKALGEKCLEELTELGVVWKKATATRKVAVPITVPAMDFAGLKLTPIFRKPPFVIDCHLARAIARAAPDILASDVTELRFSTIHEYRRVRLRGRTLKALSRHSLGLAVDVYELVRTDGTKVVVAKDYRGSAHAHAVEATLLASGELRALLTPGNDPRSHHDHFHLEAKMTIPTPAKPTKRARKRRKRLRK